MNTKKQNNASFILEFVIVIFFFMIAAAVLSRVYANTAQTVSTSRQETETYLQMRSVASVYSHSGGNLEAALLTFEKCGYFPILQEGKVVIYLNSDWKALENIEDAAYKLEIEDNSTGELLKTAVLKIYSVKNEESKLAEMELAAATL